MIVLVIKALARTQWYMHAYFKKFQVLSLKILLVLANKKLYLLWIIEMGPGFIFPKMFFVSKFWNASSHFQILEND